MAEIMGGTKMEPFIHGMILSLGLILPLGIQNLFVLNQGMTQPALIRTFPVVITAALCDTFIILAGVHGVSVLIMYMGWLKNILLAGGVLFLSYMGWLTWRSKPQESAEEPVCFSSKQQIFFAASVSLLNPHAILDTVGVIGVTALGYAGQAQTLFTGACILVSWCWFFFLALLGRAAGRHSFAARGSGLLNKGSALFIWGSALYMAYNL